VRVTALEHYGECPFKFFAGAMLGLTERSAARLSGMDLGMVRHDILETLFNHLEQGRGPEGLAWGKIDPLEADALIERRLAHWRRVEGFGARLEGDALESATLAQLGLDLKLLARSLKMAGARCAFVQTGAEWAFGQQGEVIIEAGGLRLALRGKIDRVDSLPLHAGVELQLLSYGLALRRMARREGRTYLLGGMFYWPLAAPMTEAARGEEAAAEEAGAGQEAAQASAGAPPLVDERWFAQSAPSGLFSAEQAGLLDMTVEAGQKSPVFGFRRNKDGGLAKSGRGAWPAGAIDRWLDHGEAKIQEWVEAIVAGKIALAPYATPKRKKVACQTCAMDGVCRRADLAVIPYRDLPPVSREQLAREWGLGEK
jgi:ATP-dependent helicase/DNAse subunit B